MDGSAPQGRVVIAGGTGFLGLALARHLASRLRPIEVTLIARHPPKATGPWTFVAWDGRSLGPWFASLEGARAMVNLAGRSVDCVKSTANRAEILRSRVDATHVLGQAMRTLRNPPPVWVQMSTAHIYGDPPASVRCDEDSPPGTTGMAPMVGQAWEQAFNESILPSQRGVVLRTSFVIGRPDGEPLGALRTLEPLARLGLGGRVGDGLHGFSWIHLHDMNRLMERAITDVGMRGMYVATSPHPVSQREFMRELRRAAGGLGRLGIGLPAPRWAVALGARWVLRTDPELATLGRYAVSKRLQADGFRFQFPTLREAFEDLYRRAPTMHA